MRSKETICELLKQARSCLRDIRRLDERGDEEALRYAVHDAKRVGAILEEIVEDIQERADHMENRLREYHDAITGLGFWRKK